MHAVFLEWGISDQVRCIVTDNAPNMIKTAELLQIRHLPCFSHSLNFVIKNAVRSIKEENSFMLPDDNDDEISSRPADTIQLLINMCKDIVSFFHKTPKATRTLNCIKKENVEDGEQVGALVSHIDVRWNTLLHMLKSVVDNIEYVKKVVVEEEYKLKTLKNEEILAIKEIINVLEPFEEATKQISGDKYITVFTIVP